MPFAHNVDVLRVQTFVVDAAHGVPDFVAGKRIAEQYWLKACLAMFSGSPAGKRGFRMVGIRVLQPLTLANGVVGEHDESIAREERSHAGIVGLATEVMAGCHQNCGKLRIPILPIGKVEQRGDREIRLALEKDLPDTKAIALGLAKRLGVERCGLGEFAEKPLQVLSDLALPGFGLGAGTDLSYRCGTFRGIRRSQKVEKRIQLLAT